METASAPVVSTAHRLPPRAVGWAWGLACALGRVPAAPRACREEAARVPPGLLRVPLLRRRAFVLRRRTPGPFAPRRRRDASTCCGRRSSSPRSSRWRSRTTRRYGCRRASWLKMASTLCGDSAPSASLDHGEAQAAPTHPRARPQQLGSLPWPPELASGRPKVEDVPLSTIRSRCFRAFKSVPPRPRLGPAGEATALLRLRGGRTSPSALTPRACRAPRRVCRAGAPAQLRLPRERRAAAAAHALVESAVHAA